MAKICCVDGCSSSKEEVFFNFPNSRTMRRKWMDVITTRKKLPDDSLVCSQHFLKDQYEVFRGKTRLKAKVVPSLNVRVITPDKPMRNSPPIVNNSVEINVSMYIDTIKNSPCIDKPDTIVTDSNSGLASKDDKASPKEKLSKKKPKVKDKDKIISEDEKASPEEKLPKKKSKVKDKDKITSEDDKVSPEEKLPKKKPKVKDKDEITSEDDKASPEEKLPKKKPKVKYKDKITSEDDKASPEEKLPKKKPKVKDKNKIKQNGVISREERGQELSDIENKDIEDIITNYHIKQTVPNMLHTIATDMGNTENGGQNRTSENGEKDVIEINDDHTEPQFIEISADKGQDGQADGQDCLMVLENVQVDVDPNLMFPDIGDEEGSSNDSVVVHIGDKNEDPISLLTSSDEDEVIIQEPKIDTVELSDETDEDDVPLVKLVKVKKKTKSKVTSNQTNLFQLGGHEYYCDECDYTTHSHAELKKHKNTHSTIIQVCPICSYSTASRYQFIRHKRKHKHEKQYQCHVCEYKAKHHMSLIYHLKTHNVDNTKCDRCSYTSTVELDFLKHLKHCGVEKLYKCVLCTYQTWKYTHLKRHRLRVHR